MTEYGPKSEKQARNDGVALRQRKMSGRNGRGKIAEAAESMRVMMNQWRKLLGATVGMRWVLFVILLEALDEGFAVFDIRIRLPSRVLVRARKRWCRGRR